MKYFFQTSVLLLSLVPRAKRVLALLQPSGIEALSRQEFLLAGLLVPTGLQLQPSIFTSKSIGIKKNGNSKLDTIDIPLTFLPRGGCLAVKVALNDRTNTQQLFGYYAIVDTGSPFLTAPPEIVGYSKDESRCFPPTQEQYGEAVGGMQWRSLANVGMLTTNYEEPLTIPIVIAGLPESNVVDDTGGIFLGLIGRDDNRPSLLQQCGYTSFILDYLRRLLTLSRQSTIPLGDDGVDSPLLDLFDLSPYGKNVHHYGVQSQSFTVLSDKTKKAITISSLKRPVVAVIDSGLTGCIFSDSLQKELVDKGLVGRDYLKRVNGLQISLPTTTMSSIKTDKVQVLSSNPDYWNLSSFKLPWFEDDDNVHPHIIVMGATFLSKSKVSIDPVGRKAKIDIFPDG